MRLHYFDDLPDPFNAIKWAYKKFLRKEEKYGDSYKSSSIDFLRNRLTTEFAEWIISVEKENNAYERGELQDLINLATMILWRLERE